MKKGFTMIELIFVIVILGILAAVAIPKLAATRDDAKAASIKTDIGTALQALPAWFQGQKEVSFLNAMSLDIKIWSHTDGKCQYVYTDGSGGTVTMSAENNDSTDVGDCSSTAVDANETKQPTLVITLSPATGNNAGSGIVYTLQHDMGVTDANVSLGGRKVKW